MYCPSYFGEHHTGSMSCQLACDVGICGQDITDRLGKDYRWLSGVVMAVSHQVFRFEIESQGRVI